MKIALSSSNVNAGMKEITADRIVLYTSNLVIRVTISNLAFCLIEFNIYFTDEQNRVIQNA